MAKAFTVNATLFVAGIPVGPRLPINHKMPPVIRRQNNIEYVVEAGLDDTGRLCDPRYGGGGAILWVDERKLVQITEGEYFPLSKGLFLRFHPLAGVEVTIEPPAPEGTPEATPAPEAELGPVYTVLLPQKGQWNVFVSRPDGSKKLVAREKFSSPEEGERKRAALAKLVAREGLEGKVVVRLSGKR